MGLLWEQGLVIAESFTNPRHTRTAFTYALGSRETKFFTQSLIAYVTPTHPLSTRARLTAERKKSGVKLIAGLTLCAIAAGWYKRFLWSPLKSRKISFH